MVQVRPIQAASRLALQVQHAVEQAPERQLTVFVSHSRFHVVWLALLSFHVVCVGLYAVWAYVHMASTLENDTAAMGYIGLISNADAFDVAGFVFAVAATAHLLATGSMLVVSARSGRLVLAEATHWTCGRKTVYRRRLWDPLVTMYKTVYQRYGDELFVLQETIEITLLSVRAYGFTHWQSRSWLLCAYVALLVLNYWSTPLLEWMLRRAKPTQRLLCHGYDMLSDLVSTLLLPAAMAWPHLPLFDRHFIWSRDTDATEEVSKYQRRAFQGVAQSWVDVLNIAVFSFFLWTRVAGIKACLKRREDTPSAKPIVPPDAPQKRTISETPRRRIDTMMHWIHASSLAWGSVIVVVHAISESRPLHGWCVGQTAPWFAMEARCETVHVDCGAAQMMGKRDEMERVFATFQPQEVLSLEITNCTGLEIPSAIQTLSSLTKLSVANSSLVQWDTSASIQDRYHPALSTVSVTDVRLSGGLPEGLCCSDRLPSPLTTFIFDRTQLSMLPTRLDEVWDHPFRLSLNDNAFTQIPAVLTRLRPMLLSMANNAITAVPPGLLACGMFCGELRLSGNPIESLPDSLLGRDLPTLRLDGTRLSRLPPWVTRAPCIIANATPFCDAYEKIPPIERATWLGQQGLDENAQSYAAGRMVCKETIS